MAWPFAAPRPGQTMSYSSFWVCVVKFAALHLANGLFALTIGIGISSSPTDRGRQIIVVLSTAQRSRCGNSRRAVISKEPVCGSKRPSGQVGCADTAIPKTIAVANVRDTDIFCLKPFKSDHTLSQWSRPKINSALKGLLTGILSDPLAIKFGRPFQFRQYRHKHHNAGGRFPCILCKRHLGYPRGSVCRCHHKRRRKWFFGRDI